MFYFRYSGLYHLFCCGLGQNRDVNHYLFYDSLSGFNRLMTLTDRVVNTGFNTYLGLFHTISSRVKPGKNIYSKKWDALILLDACRVDALREVAPEYSFIESVDKVWSRGSSSHEWIARTFTTDYRPEIQKTTFTTPNGFVEKTFRDGDYPPYRSVPLSWAKNDIASADDFDLLDTPWISGQDERYDMVPPRFMTDRAIHINRNRQPDKFIIQYYQPHKPYLRSAIKEQRPATAFETEPYEARKRGEISSEELWEMYLDNLRLVLDEVEILLKNIDAHQVVLTADHGELLGELGIYGHPQGILHPKLRRVPWVRMTASDEETYEPCPDHTRHIGERDFWGGNDHEEAVNEQLEALGYR
jgi:hypothetical protein